MAISTEDALEFLDASDDPRADWMAGQLRGNAEELARTDITDAGRRSLESHQSMLLRDAEQMQAESAMAEMGLDPEFANPACDCEPGEPCCLISGEVADSEDPTRKVTWPVLNDTHPTRLYVIAKKVEGFNLAGKVKSKLNPSKACVCGIQPHRGVNANNPVGDPNPLPISETEQSIAVPRAPNFQILGSEILPESFVIAMSAVDAIMTATQSFEEGNEVNYVPYMCLPEDGMGSALRVKAIPQIKLEGKSEATISVGFYTVGVTSAAGVTAGLTGEVGDRTIEVEAEAKAEVSAAAAAPVEEDNGESGMTGFIGNMIGKMAKFASKGTKESDGINTEEASSGVMFTFKLGLEATGLELKPVGGAPDLKLETGKFGVYLSLEATGKIDVIEAISVALLSPAAARAVQKIRQAAADGETVKGVAKAEIELSAEGELKQSYDSGFSYLLSANGQSRFERGESGATFGGKVTLSGTATVLIHAELETWIVSAEAGAGGSLHTAWVWEMEKQGGTRKKRSYFEGLRARVVAYAGLSIGSSDDPDEPEIGDGRDTTPGITVESTGQASQEIARVGRDLEAEEFDPERDAWLIEPTVPNVTDSSPPWENY